ncbi:hypothetical protein Syun_006797 [Stephania yunnanensis]|uniref:Uncharacterized protein n=1 Tax=Stephania yunnanensis TaxID=152371 RepID=A0AAP0KXJ7_9MAGN
MLSSDRMGAPPWHAAARAARVVRQLRSAFLALFARSAGHHVGPFRGKADDCDGSCASNLKLLGAMNCWCIMLVRACGWGRWKTVYKWLCLFSSSCVHLKKTSCALNIVPSLPGKGGQCGVSLVSSRNATWLICPVVICLSQRLSHACVRIPSKRESSARVDYVPPLYTHTPSLLPIEWSGEVFGSRRRGGFAADDVARSPLEPYHLEEGEVVTRFP